MKPVHITTNGTQWAPMVFSAGELILILTEYIIFFLEGMIILFLEVGARLVTDITGDNTGHQQKVNYRYTASH